MSFIVIESSDDLNYLNKELLQRNLLGIDTEFKRFNKDKIILSLIQVNDSEETFLIDCLSIGKDSSNASFLFSDGVKKIFHSFREDFEAIFSWTKERTQNIFDTQLANAFLGGKFSVGYKELVFEELGVSVDKEETRSNWIKRPLRDAQLAYAASDVEFLIDLFHNQNKELSLNNKIDWYFEQQLINERNLLLSDPRETLDSYPKINKKLERKYLLILGKHINDLAHDHKINPTLLFSKKDQKDFLSEVFSFGLETALNGLPRWKMNILSNTIQLIQFDKHE